MPRRSTIGGDCSGAIKVYFLAVTGMSREMLGFGLFGENLLWINFSCGKCRGGELCWVGVEIPMQDYKCVRVAVVIGTLLVNALIHRQLLTGYILGAHLSELKNEFTVTGNV